MAFALALRLSPSRALRKLPYICRPQRSLHISAASAGPGVETPDVRHLARMAHLEVSDEQVADWGPKIEKIVEWFGALQEVDVEGVPPALRPGTNEAGDGGSRLRADTPVEFAERKAMLQQVPELQGEFVKVPKIATAADD